MPAFPVLAISNGVTTVNLLDPKSGFLLKEWFPARAAMNATRRNSLFSGGSVVRMYSLADIVDTFTVAVRHVDQDNLIQNCQDLDRLLLQAVDFWATSWSGTPVWIEARGARETNSRYAIIKSYQVAGEGNPYAQPFSQALCEAGHEAITVAVEHGLWRSVNPTTSETIQLTTLWSFNSHDYGREKSAPAAAGDEWFVANKHNIANISNVYYHISGGAWSANLLPLAGAPTRLLPAAPGDLDELYFGCATALTNSGPFTNVVLDLSLAAVYVGTAHCHWQYYNGGWVTLLVNDGTFDPEYNDVTHPFQVLGVCNLSFEQPADWTTVAVNGVQGYWIRCVVNLPAGGDSMTPPWQHNRYVYTCTWPCVDIDSEDIGGDLPALLRLRFHARSTPFSGVSPVSLTPTRVYVGLRSLDRGTHFSAYINWSNEQNGAGVGIGNLTADTTFITSMLQASGKCAQYAPAAAKAMTTELNASFIGGGAPADFTNEYRGQFVAFLRYATAAGTATGDIQAQFQVFNVGGGVRSTQIFPLTASLIPTLLNMGRVTFPISPVSNTTQSLDGHGFALRLQNTIAGARTCYLLDLILMPCDEWFGIFEDPLTYATSTTMPLDGQAILVVDSAQSIKESPYAAVEAWLERTPWTMEVQQRYTAYAAGDAILQANKDQRLWFLQEGPVSNVTLPRFPYNGLLASVRCQIAKRYQSMRGAR